MIKDAAGVAFIALVVGLLIGYYLGRRGMKLLKSRLAVAEDALYNLQSFDKQTLPPYAKTDIEGTIAFHEKMRTRQRRWP